MIKFYIFFLLLSLTSTISFQNTFAFSHTEQVESLVNCESSLAASELNNFVDSLDKDYHAHAKYFERINSKVFRLRQWVHGTGPKKELGVIHKFLLEQLQIDSLASDLVTDLKKVFAEMSISYQVEHENGQLPSFIIVAEADGSTVNRLAEYLMQEGLRLVVKPFLSVASGHIDALYVQEAEEIQISSELLYNLPYFLAVIEHEYEHHLVLTDKKEKSAYGPWVQFDLLTTNDPIHNTVGVGYEGYLHFSEIPAHLKSLERLIASANEIDQELSSAQATQELVRLRRGLQILIAEQQKIIAVLEGAVVRALGDVKQLLLEIEEISQDELRITKNGQSVSILFGGQPEVEIELSMFAHGASDFAINFTLWKWYGKDSQGQEKFEESNFPAVLIIENELHSEKDVINILKRLSEVL